MKHVALPVVFAATMALAACGGSGSKAVESAISLSPSSTAKPTPSSTSSTSHTSVPATSATHSSSTSTAAQTPKAAVNSSAAPLPTTKKVAPAPASTHMSPTKAVVPAPAPSSKKSTTPAAPATQVSKVWPGAGWNIQTIDSDPCLMMGESTAYPSGFSADTWTCGPNSAGLIACKKDASGNALCIQDYARRMAARFKTTATVSGNASGNFNPLAVKLSNGMMCSIESHDQAQHYQNRQGWLYCDNGGTLLLPAGNGGETPAYFDKSGSTWTAQLGMGTNAPTTVKVAQVYYAQ